MEAASFGNHWPNTANPIFEMVGYVNGKYLYLNSFSWNLEVPQVTQSTPLGIWRCHRSHNQLLVYEISAGNFQSIPWFLSLYR